VLQTAVAGLKDAEMNNKLEGLGKDDVYKGKVLEYVSVLSPLFQLPNMLY
jgi:hypothetical protein